MANKHLGDTAKSIASALAFASYIISNLTEFELGEIKRIVWLAKAGQIFIDISKNDDFKKKIVSIAKQYLHPINFDVGQRDKTLESAIVIYSKFKEEKAGAAKTLISWDVVKPESARVLLNKRLFGYVHHGVSYPGLVEKYSAEKIGKGCVAIPSQYSEIFLALFKDMKIPISVKEVREVG